MKFNKSSFVAVIALGSLVALSTFVQAEDTKPAATGGAHKRPGGPGGDMKERGAKIAEELGLSDDQKAKMTEMMKELGPKMKALMEDNSLSKEEKMPKMKALNEERNAKLKEILTPEQLEKFQKMQAAHRPGGPGGPKGKKADKPE